MQQYHLFVETHSVKTMVHDIHPAVFRGENEECHQSIEDVVKVVFLVGPLVARVLETVSSICDVLSRHCFPLAIEEQSFEQLKQTFRTYNRFSGEGVKNLT